MLCFLNPGEIDPRLITTLGVNVKPDSPNPIGYFGTGLKYAIAGTLRLHGSLTIWSGLRQFTFAVERDSIRGKEFEFIRMVEWGDGAVEHDQVLAFTTELGKNWKPWMLCREFYSNMADENGEATQDTPPQPSPNTTQFNVDCPAIEEAWTNRHEWILASASIEKGTLAEIHPGTGHVFNKGIRVGAVNGLYNYNVLAELTLTEDRTAAEYQHRFHVAKTLAESSALGQDSLVRVICDQDHWERNLDFDYGNFAPSVEFLSAVEVAHATRPTKVNASAWALYLKHSKEKEYEDFILTPVQEKMLARALAFLASIGFQVDEPIRTVRGLGHGVYGRAKNGTIWLSPDCFNMGGRFVCSTLLEEHIHLSRGFYDMTRDMQNFLFEKIISLGEELKGEPV